METLNSPSGWSRILRNRDQELIGTALLLLASLLVGVAIASPEPISRAVNGVSGILWFSGAAFLILAVRDDDRFWRRLAVVALMGMVLVLAVRPSDLVMAAIGFGSAGALIALLMGARGLAWAKVLPALWLPEHLLTAVSRALYRSVRDLPTSIRSDPPPTAALVPFAMVVAAMGAAWLVHCRRHRTFPTDKDRAQRVSSRP